MCILIYEMNPRIKVDIKNNNDPTFLIHEKKSNLMVMLMGMPMIFK